MMSWFTEDSTPILVWGAVIEALLIFALVKTGRVVLLYVMVGVALLAGGIVWKEKHTVTDTKLLRAALYDAAKVVESNDPKNVLPFISPNADRGQKEQILRYMGMLKFNEVHVWGEEIQVNRFTAPPTATIEFSVRLNVEDRSASMPYNNALLRLKATFELDHLEDGDHWLATGYEIVQQPGVR